MGACFRASLGVVAEACVIAVNALRVCRIVYSWIILPTVSVQNKSLFGEIGQTSQLPLMHKRVAQHSPQHVCVR